MFPKVDWDSIRAIAEKRKSSYDGQNWEKKGSVLVKKIMAKRKLEEAEGADTPDSKALVDNEVSSTSLILAHARPDI